jgi:hypothetical protein
MDRIFMALNLIGSKLWWAIRRMGSAFAKVWGAIQCIWLLIWRWLFKIAVIPVIVLFISYFFWLSPRDVSYRYSYPNENACKTTQAFYAEALAFKKQDNKSQLDFNNDETVAIANAASLPENPALAAPLQKPSSSTLRTAFTCMIQTHLVPRADGKGNLKYNLAFLEFTEAGLPIEFSENGVRLTGKTQLQELLDFLRKVQAPGKNKTNFIISFVHGWRHDASLGDGDIRKLRVFAAYTAGFLAQRCETDESFCQYEVTAVYVGWRGARLDENWLGKKIGTPGAILDAIFGQLPALLTLFDRKPVSERIGPAIVSALRQIDRVIYDRDKMSDQNWKQRPESRMVTFGHSLGGNALASALREEFVQRIRRHNPNANMAAPFGDLIVLLNPASEASNWTALQRAMRERIVFDHANRTSKPPIAPTQSPSPSDQAILKSEEMDELEIQKGHWLFPRSQRPIYISLTAANTWPVGGIRRSDCDSYRQKPELEKEARQLTHVQYLPKYDFATHDAFPAFKFDFRPLADTLEHYANYRPGTQPLDQYCSDAPKGLTGWLTEGAAAFLRNFPFMNTNPEETRTIGHLNPSRSTIGAYTNNIRTATFYGTTHELTIIDPRGPDPKEKSASANYLLAGDFDKSRCQENKSWLSESRDKNKASQGRGWTHAVTLFSKKQGEKNVELKSQFLHGYVASGMLPIVRANDPFWNVRVFDTGMQYHGDYDSFPLICTIQQLVIDDVTNGRR